MKQFRSFSALLISTLTQHFCVAIVASAQYGSNWKFFREKDNCDQNCFSVVLEILNVARTFHSTGQVLVSRDWFQGIQRPYLQKLHGESGVPWLVYGDPRRKNEGNVSNVTSLSVAPNKFTSSKFAHLHHSTFAVSSSSPAFLIAQRQQTWRKMLYLTFRKGMRISDMDSRKAGLTAAWHTFIQKDLFIVTFDIFQLLDLVTSKKSVIPNGLTASGSRQIHSMSKHTIWIGCAHDSDDATPVPKANGTTVLASEQLCIYSSRRDFTSLLGHMSHCKDRSITMHIDRFHQFLANLKVGSGVKRNLLPTKRSAGGGAVTDLAMNDQDEQDTSSGFARRKVDPLSRKGFLYSSLVFITKKLPDSNTTSSNVWGPFTIASWIGILAAYTVTAIVFAVIKIITMNNLENSWYDCIFNHLLSFLNDDDKITTAGSPSKISGPAESEEVATVSSSTVGVNLVDENDNEVKGISSGKHLRHFLQGESSRRDLHILETRRISVQSLTFPTGSNQRRISHPIASSVSPSPATVEENEVTFVRIKYHETRGKISKSIIYGTIRVVSFILLAMYEGKLYNTITFPKSRLVATFDELISNDKYFVKISSEAAKIENITTRVKGNITYGNLSSYDIPGGLVTSTSSGGNFNNSRSGGGNIFPTGGGKYVESVNILDCVNWVESGPDPNHACVGYEFELRNLHKAQKSDKILIRSKQRLLRFNSAGTSSVVMTGGSAPNSGRLIGGGRRRGFTLFPGGFQISKWILESGILQLWSIVENAFMESVVNPNWGDPFKVFTIRDYLGLFVVYSMLLILASIMFLLEHIVTLLKRLLKSRNAKKIFKSAWGKCATFRKKHWAERSSQCCKCSSWNYCEDSSALRDSCWTRVFRCRQGTLDAGGLRRKKYFQSWSAINKLPV